MFKNMISLTNIREHGVFVDKSRNRVKCNYCEKVVSGFNRLKYHLGGIRKNVLPCIQVPIYVKEEMRETILASRKEKLLKNRYEFREESKSCIQNLVSKQIESGEFRIIKEEGKMGSSEMRKVTREHEAFERSDHLHYEKNRVYRGEKNMVSSPTNKKNEDVKPFQLFQSNERKTNINIRMDSSLANYKENIEGNLEEDALRYVHRSICRFFLEANIDFTAIRSPFFEKMIIDIVSYGSGYRIPNYNELKGSILPSEIREIDKYVEGVKDSWEETGCTILIDHWTNEEQKYFLNFFSECPKGSIFLRSLDATDSNKDSNSLFLMVDQIIEEVGEENIVQILTWDNSSYMEEIGKRIAEKYKSIFWCLCSSHCIGLILKEIGIMSSVSRILKDAHSLVRSIHGNQYILKMVRMYCDGSDFIRTSRVQFAAPFLLLESIVNNRDGLVNMFHSNAYYKSTWASRNEGRLVAYLVGDSMFWSKAEEVLKAVIPLINACRIIESCNKPSIGFVYETIDQAKEAIKKSFRDKKAKYESFWKIIDDVWDNHLHNPLHSAGYFLNPGLFYSIDFFEDPEVACGVLCCIVKMVKDKNVQDKIVQQLDAYRTGAGSFSSEMAMDQRTKISPDRWWLAHGGHCPELQRFSIRILSQTCSEASKYKQRRRLSEQFHSMKGDNKNETRASEFLFLRNNLHLQHSLLSSLNQDEDEYQENNNKMDDWFCVHPTFSEEENPSSKGLLHEGT